MRKSYLEPPKMPGYPKPLPEHPRRTAPAQPAQPVLPVRTRLGWSRSVIDHSWEPAAQSEDLASVPNVRSMAALRARAGEAYRPAQRPVTQPEFVPSPVVAPKPVAVAIQKPMAHVVAPPAPEWERPIQPLRPSFFRTAWETVLEFVPRLPRISE